MSLTPSKELDEFANDPEKTGVSNSQVIPVENELEDIDPVIEKRAIKKIDRNLIPVFCLLYALSFLDRANIGNANLTGFSQDLNLVGNQFGAAVSIVYSTYTVFEPIWSVLLKILTPVTLTGSTVAWSSLTVGTAFVTNFSQLAACRVLLGVFEAGVIPCATLYLTTTYRRNEYVTRQTWIFVSSALSGAFGGLLAFGLQHVSAGNMKGWQWLYLVEGLMSFCLIPVVWFWLPNTVTQARWLNKDEKRVMTIRQEANKRFYDSQEKFVWSAITAALKDPRLYIHAVGHYGIDCTLYSLTTFMPKIVAGLGFTTTVEAQLLTVPVYVLAAISYIIQGRLSDKYSKRYIFILGSLCACLLVYIILAAASQPGARYAGVFIASIGLYTTTALHNLWVCDNFAGHYKRAFAMGFVVMIGNSSGACIGFIFTAQSAPRYFKGIYFDIAMTLLAIVSATVNYLIARRANANKAKLVAAGAPDDISLGDKNPHYPFLL